MKHQSPKIDKENISKTLSDIRASRDPNVFFDFCEKTGYEPIDKIEQELLYRYFSNRAAEEKILQMRAEEIINRQKTSNPQREKAQSPLIQICLGGGSPNNKFLLNQLFAIQLIEDPLGRLYPYLNPSEALSIISNLSYLKSVLPHNDLYGALNVINKKFFPGFIENTKDLDKRQYSLLEKLEVYGKKQNLSERIHTAPKEIREGLIEGIMNPPMINLRTKVPVYQKVEDRQKHIKTRAKEISGIFNTFPKNYFPKFC